MRRRLASLMGRAQWERRAIGQRTKEALAAKKAQGAILGRPRQLPAATRARIVGMHSNGLSLGAISETLNSEGVPTAQGGALWTPRPAGRSSRTRRSTRRACASYLAITARAHR